MFFFFKQKTAYEMRISDWSSDVCSSDLVGHGHQDQAEQYRALHPQAHIEDAADEDADQVGDEAEADVVGGDLFVAEVQILQQQSHREVRQRVADLVDQHEQQDQPGAAAAEKLGQRPDRSEERRGGKEGGSKCSTRGSPYQYKKQRKHKIKT